jgi:hypothetical protein
MTRLGLDCKLYRNTGTYASPVWNEMPNVSDVTIPLSKGEADTSTRASKWKTRKGTLKDASIDFQLKYVPGDTDYAALLASYIDGTTIDLLALDGPVGTTGSQGLRAVCEVFNFQEGQALESAVTFDVSAKPAPAFDTNGAPITPTWFTVPAGGGS